MKRLFLLSNLIASLASISLLSCNKTSIDTPEQAFLQKPTSEEPVEKSTSTMDLHGVPVSDIQAVISGGWQLIYTHGGFSGEEHILLNNVYYSFGNATFTVNDNGNVITKPYNWEVAYSEPSGGYFMAAPGYGWYFEGISNDTLYAHQVCSDGHRYALIKTPISQ